MNLTQEKCRDSLSNLYYVLQGRYCEGCNYDESEFCAKCNIKEDLHVMRKLIHEHFDNPHLKFEELCEGMWVWDDEFKDWIKIKIVFKPCKLYPKGSLKAYHDLNEEQLDFIEFKENRFYRKQVEE